MPKVTVVSDSRPPRPNHVDHAVPTVVESGAGDGASLAGGVAGAVARSEIALLVVYVKHTLKLTPTQTKLTPM
jgi:hypothetical protein